MLITLIDSWQHFLKAGKPRWSRPCNARLRRVLCSDHMLVCPPWSHRIVPQVMRHGSQKMLAEIGHLLGVITEEQTFPSRLFRTAALSLGYMAPDVAWVGGQIFLATNTKRTPKRLDMFGRKSRSFSRFQTWIFVNLLAWRSTRRNKRSIVLDIEECFPMFSS